VPVEPKVLVVGTTADYIDWIQKSCPGRALFLTEPGVRRQAEEPCPLPGEEILSNFHTGKYMRIVTSRVLDEGVNVPDASMAVILSGSGSNRQFIQRLGRILRKTPGKEAFLHELVSAGTAEIYMSYRRKQ